jgi:hypothetical protein
MRIARCLAWAAGVCVACSLWGCSTNVPTPKGYFGPTLNMGEVVAQINRNNDQIPTLWARHEFDATVVDPDTHKSQYVNGYGNILYKSADSLRLTAKKEVTDLFDMGTNGENYWLRVVPGQDTYWYGNFSDENAAAEAHMPLQPDLILEVLGIRPIDSALAQPPVPVMRFNNDADAYMLVWQSRVGDHWAAQKEIWYDRATLHPILVLLFDPNGRVELRAWLSNFKTIRVTDESADQWPSIATSFRLFFPETGTKMSFDLRDIELSHNGFPKAVSFRMPDPKQLAASGVKVVPVNENSGS